MAPEPKEFPEIAVDGQPIEAERFVEAGTGAAVAAGFVLAIIGALFLAAVTWGVAIVGYLVLLPVSWYMNRKAMAMIRGSGLRVNERQLPQIHKCVEVFARRLGLKTLPEVFVVESAVQNAVAVRFGKKNVILLTDDLIHGCLLAGSPKALAFVIGHEMAHIALKHNGLLRTFMAGYYKKLRRLDEYSADRVGRALVNDKETALDGMVLLTVGPQIMSFLNWQELGQQVIDVEADKYSQKAERTLNHPLLLHRIGRIVKG
jgi:Zn-dependent protease with chaperone function